MNIKLTPFFGVSWENKRRNDKLDVVDFVDCLQKVHGEFDFEVYKFLNFCCIDGTIENLLIIFVGRKYSVYKLNG